MNHRRHRLLSIFLVMMLVLAFMQSPNLSIHAQAMQLSSFTAQQISRSIVLKLDSANTLVNTIQKQLDSASADVKPIVKNSTTFVPLRFMSENLGAAVAWDQKTQTASVVYGSKTIKAPLNQKYVKINNVTQTIAAPVFQISGRVYVPLRIISETFGKNVLYNNGIIIISSAKPNLDATGEQQLVSELITWFSKSDMPELTVRQIVQRYDDSVVTILVNDYYGQTIGQGTGFYIGNGLFVTNNHVLSEGYSYDLLFNNGNFAQAAGVVRYDANKDVAILKAKQIPTLNPVSIGSKSMVQKGDRIVTISSPEGLNNTVSDGLVSAFRSLAGGIDLIQITAPITHGSSGSPLFNMQGYVVGINTLGYEGSGNLNFALAIDAAAAWIKELAAKDFKTITVINQMTYISQGGSTPAPSEMPQAPIQFDIGLDFEITDAVKHPAKPIIYISDKLSGKLYAVNYETKEQKSISFQYSPESLDYHNGEIYVALPKHQHSSYIWEEQQQGAIAVVDAERFTLKDQFDISIDPFDLAAGRDGNIYISSGSGQWTSIVSYSLSTKKQVAKTMVRQQSYLAIHPVFSKIYTVNTDVSPRDIGAVSFSGGSFKEVYDSPYHGDYSLGTKIRVSPDGRYVFNNSGNVFTAGLGRDLTYAGKLGSSYNDIAFDLQGGIIYTGSDGGQIGIYDYSTFKQKGTTQTKGNVLFMFYENGSLISITRDDNKTLNKVANGIMITNVQ